MTAALVGAVRDEPDGPVQSAMVLALDDLYYFDGYHSEGYSDGSCPDQVPDEVAAVFRDIAVGSHHQPVRGVAVACLLRAGQSIDGFDPVGPLTEAILAGRPWNREGMLLLERAGGDPQLRAAVIAALVASAIGIHSAS